MRYTCPFFLILFIFITNCNHSKTDPISEVTIQPSVAPSDSISGEPNLVVGDDGGVYLSWIERAGEGRHALRFTVYESNRWVTPKTVAEGENWFVNWADFPSLAVSADGAMAAHWLAKSADTPYAYDVRIAQSFDGGSKWHMPLTPHSDGTPTEHGFVSMLPQENDRTLAIWLDGRNTGRHSEAGSRAMTLRAAVIDRVGGLHDEAELDNRICDCCQTAAVRTASGVVAAYRDRSEAEIRDISVVRLRDGAWTKPQAISKDGWKIKACPVNGPVLAADERNVALAWFTNADDRPRVKVAFSKDEGVTFGQPVVVSNGVPMGRASAVMLLDGTVLVGWMESLVGAAEFRVRRIHSDGKADPEVTVTSMNASRRSGFPRMARRDDTLFFAWTHYDSTTSVRVATATLAHAD